MIEKTIAKEKLLLYNKKWLIIHIIQKMEGNIYMVFEKVKKIITEQLGVDEKEIKLESAFIEDLGADSLDIVELIMAMESEFDMEIEDDEVEDISTVEDVVEYIKEHSSAE